MKNEVTEGQFWDKFHEKHNPRYYHATKIEKKIKEKIKEKDQKQKDDPSKFKVFGE